MEIGGIEQWITIRGEDRGNPVLLFLHGGPGDATNLWGYAGFRSWLRYFTVVQWDQRGAGRTLGRNGPSLGPTITIDRMTRDGIELAELLRRTLNHDRIILVGHSWGSILGVRMVKTRPDLFYAFVGTGQVAADPTRNYAVAYEEVLKAAKRRVDQRAVTELEQVGPPPWRDGRGYAVQRRWANLFEGADTFLASTLGLALAAPGYTARDVNDWLSGQRLSAERLVPQTNEVDAAALGGEFSDPGVRDPGRRGLHHTHGSRQELGDVDSRAAKSVRHHRRRRTLRRVHEVGCVSDRAGRASASAGEAALTFHEAARGDRARFHAATLFFSH